MIKLNIGCGWRNFGKDWVHIDGGDYNHLDYKDIENLPFDDKSVDVIYASHVLSYFDREEAFLLLKEWNRVLKIGGILRIAVPDFKSMSALYNKGEITLDRIIGPLYGKMKMSDSTIYHKSVYDFESLTYILNKSGFTDCVEYNWRYTDHSMFDDHSQAYIPHMDKENGTLISLNVESIKK